MLTLASASPRRREILKSAGIPFEVVLPGVQEVEEGDPEGAVLENARRKALAGFEAGGKGALTLGVDTDVVLDGRILGKAVDRAEAREHLKALSGRKHMVLSGLVLYGASGGAEPIERCGVARSEVTFRKLDQATIETYLASGEWRDRAGAYAIQGLGSILIDRVEGDFSNVVGLPLRLLLELAPELLDPAGASGPDPGPNANP